MLEYVKRKGERERECKEDCWVCMGVEGRRKEGGGGGGLDEGCNGCMWVWMRNARKV